MNRPLGRAAGHLRRLILPAFMLWTVVRLRDLQDEVLAADESTNIAYEHAEKAFQHARNACQYADDNLQYVERALEDAEKAVVSGRSVSDVVREAVHRYLRTQRRASRATGSAR